MRNSIVIKGEARWPSLFEVNDLSKKFQMDICNLNKAAVKALDDEGIPVKIGEGEKKEYGHYITAKTKRGPKVTDAAKQLWPKKLLIGNGSKVKVSVSAYDWNFKNTAGRSASLNSVMIIDLKEFDGAPPLDAEEDGFVLDTLDEEVPFDTDDNL